MTISSNASGSPHSIGLSGTGIPTPAVAVLSSSGLSYGFQRIGTTSGARSVTLTNAGGSALTLNNITVDGDFARVGGTCPTSYPTTLAAGTSCTISLAFSPTAAGTRVGALTISSDASGSPQAASLSGTSTTFFTVFLPLAGDN